MERNGSLTGSNYPVPEPAWLTLQRRRMSSGSATSQATREWYRTVLKQNLIRVASSLLLISMFTFPEPIADYFAYQNVYNLQIAVSFEFVRLVVWMASYQAHHLTLTRALLISLAAVSNGLLLGIFAATFRATTPFWSLTLIELLLLQGYIFTYQHKLRLPVGLGFLAFLTLLGGSIIVSFITSNTCCTSVGTLAADSFIMFTFSFAYFTVLVLEAVWLNRNEDPGK